MKGRGAQAAEPPSLWLAGATQGIGAGLALRLAGSYQLLPLARSLGHDFADVDCARHLLAKHGAPWAWVHTPGAFFEEDLLATSDADWSLLLESNLWSFVRSARVILPAMAQQGGGRVVAFGVAGLSVANAKVMGPAYFAVKAALLSCVRSLASDFAAAGVTCNMLSPGAIEHEQSHRPSQERALPRIPSGRLGRPQDLAGIVEFLLSREAEYITGQEICVDGGLSLGAARQ